MKIDMKLVFIQFGSKLPKHLISNLERTKTIFPDSELVLISNITEELALLKKNVKIVKWDEEKSSFLVENKLAFSEIYRNGFWLYSLLRIVVLLDWMIESQSGPVLHIESDMLLFKSFPMSQVSKINKIAWGSYNEHRDVGSLVFIPNSRSALNLREEIVKLLNEDEAWTDMTLLKQIAKRNKDLVRYFPNGLRLSQNKFIEDKSRIVEISQVLDQELPMDGIFDSASLGMWLLGQDPRNHYGFTRYFARDNINNGDSFVDPGYFQYQALETGLEIKRKSETYPIYCIHVHSKNTELFRDYNNNSEFERIMENYKKTSNGKYEHQEFSILSLISILIQEYRGNTLLRYIAFSPLFRWLTRIILRRKLKKKSC